MKADNKPALEGASLASLEKFISYAEFKRLFDSLDRLVKEKEIRSLSCLSFHAEEGKSFICAAIALGFAGMLGKRILLVDAGNPTSNWDLQDIFGTDTKGIYTQEGLVYSLATNLDCLKLSSLALVVHKAQEYRVQDIIAEYKNRYDLILFDSAALRSANRGNFDPWVIAARTDGSLLITSMKTTDLERQFQLEPMLRSKVVGVVENLGAE